MSACCSERHFALFARRYAQLEDRLLYLAQKDPEGYVRHEEVKFFKRVRNAMNVCLEDPSRKEYEMGDLLARQQHNGKSLGKGHGHWRRIKKDMPSRYRLFFVFSLAACEVIFAWLNDEDSLRRAGHKKDVYAVFARLVASGKIPGLYSALKKESVQP